MQELNSIRAVHVDSRLRTQGCHPPTIEPKLSQPETESLSVSRRIPSWTDNKTMCCAKSVINIMSRFDLKSIPGGRMGETAVKFTNVSLWLFLLKITASLLASNTHTYAKIYTFIYTSARSQVGQCSARAVACNYPVGVELCGVSLVIGTAVIHFLIACLLLQKPQFCSCCTARTECLIKQIQCHRLIFHVNIIIASHKKPSSHSLSPTHKHTHLLFWA